MNKRASISDIVDKTGLSRSTVDRVINRRSGVRSETRQLVERTLQEMGYAANALDALRKKAPMRIEVHLCEGSNPFFQEIWNGLQTAFDQSDGPETSVAFCGYDPYRPGTLAANLAKVGDDVECVAVLSSDSPDVTAAINTLRDRGKRVVTMIADTPMSRRSAFVGQGNFQAGLAAGRLMGGMLRGCQGQVAMLIGHLEFRHLLDRRAGFEQFIGMNCPDLTAVSVPPYGSEPETSRKIVRDLLGQHDQLCGIYLCGGGQPALFEAIAQSGPDVRIVAHEVTSQTRAALIGGQLDAIVAHDMAELGRNVFDAVTEASVTGMRTCGIHIYLPENVPPASGF